MTPEDALLESVVRGTRAAATTGLEEDLARQLLGLREAVRAALRVCQDLEVVPGPEEEAFRGLVRLLRSLVGEEGGE